VFETVPGGVLGERRVGVWYYDAAHDYESQVQGLRIAEPHLVPGALLIIDEPTRGIDVGTKAEVHRLLDSLVADGLAVLMISSELLEVLGMADRVIVLREGRIAADLTRAEADEDSIMRAATGQSPVAAA